MAAPAPTPGPELPALATWQTVDFISDLHLQASEPETLAAWQRYMAHSPADALFILGDLFEVWVGDDALQASQADGTPRFEAQCQTVLRDGAQRMAVYFMPGNRDFLLGEQAAQACQFNLLHDPTVLIFDQQRWLLSHGDALCVDDVAYQAFRSQVRTPDWRAQFLSKPLSERDAIARALRQQSEARKQLTTNYCDLDAHAAGACLRAAQANTLIHGHTHQPGAHALGDGLRRLVLSDWDALATPPRLQVLRLRPGRAPQRLALDQAISV